MKNRPKLPIIFRCDKRGAWRDKVTAVFPTLPHSANPDTFVVYDAESGHSSGTLLWYNTTRPAEWSEYERLLERMTDLYIDYELHVVKRMDNTYTQARIDALNRRK